MEGTEANKIYILYTGECTLYAKFRNQHLKEFIDIDNDSVFKLTRGCLSGLETFKNIEERLLTK